MASSRSRPSCEDISIGRGRRIQFDESTRWSEQEKVAEAKRSTHNRKLMVTARRSWVTQLVGPALVRSARSRGPLPASSTQLDAKRNGRTGCDYHRRRRRERASQPAAALAPAIASSRCHPLSLFRERYAGTTSHRRATQTARCVVRPLISRPVSLALPSSFSLFLFRPARRRSSRSGVSHGSVPGFVITG